MNKLKRSTIIPLFLSLMLITGCAKKQDVTKSQQKSHHSKVKTSTSQADHIQAFDLDNNSMQTFALDDKLEQHQQQATSHKPHSKLFEWENLAAEDSKDNFKRIPFEFDSYTVQPQEMSTLKSNIKHAKKMIKNGKTIVCEGHACHSAGSAIYNLALSEKRARHVAKKFADAGIDSKKIKIAPRGQEMPIKKGGNREEQAINRRVEVFAIDSN